MCQHHVVLCYAGSLGIDLMPTLKDKVVFSEDVLFQDVDGEAVLLHLGTGYYYGLDEVGSRMWALLNSHGSVEQAYAALLAEYDVTEEELERDLLGLVDSLSSHGLLSIVEE